MSEPENEPTGPDLSKGVDPGDIPEGGLIEGHANGERVLLVRTGGTICGIGATCSHYSGPLAEGLVIGNEIRCPWHHARFQLSTGEALGPPALNPVPAYRVEISGGRVFVREKLPSRQHKRAPGVGPESVIIIGGGAAGNAAAEMLRRATYAGRVIMICADDAPPVDRPNLSKDYLAGTAPEEWIPLRGLDFYEEHEIELRLKTRATRVDPGRHLVSLSDGSELHYGALILATGSDPIRLPIPGANSPHVHVLRTLADSQAIVGAIIGARDKKRVVMAGASFIALEVAASLRTRGLEVHLVAPEATPLERVLGAELGTFIQSLHEKQGAVFHLGRTLKSIEPSAVTLDNGTVLPADLVVLGVGVRPSLTLAEDAGLKMDRGILVDEFLQTSAVGIYAAGDIVRWPDPLTGLPIRVEHWVVAERQGQIAALNAMGFREPFRAVPFFWSQHYDVPIAYVGHAETWDSTEIYGNIDEKNCIVAYRKNGKVTAIASIFRDRESLAIEAAMENDDQARISEILTGLSL